MTLWNIIRDFFVEHVFGGINSANRYFNGVVGAFIRSDNNTAQVGSITNVFVPISARGSSYEYVAMDIGDWLSTTATIATLIIILVVIACFIRWIFKVCSNSLLLR